MKYCIDHGDELILVSDWVDEHGKAIFSCVTKKGVASEQSESIEHSYLRVEDWLPKERHSRKICAVQKSNSLE
jgi:putative hemolysin